MTSERHRKRTSLYSWALSAATTVAMACGGSDLPPAPEAPPEEPSAPAAALTVSPPAAEATPSPTVDLAATGEGESREALEAKVLELGQRVLELEADLDQANANTREMNQRYVRMTAEREKYYGAAQRCVDELNSVASAPRRGPVQQIRPSTGGGRGAQIRGLGTPYASQVGDSVNVTGKVWNAGDAAGRATLTITLYRNGQPVDTATVYANNVAPGGDYSYSHTFRARGEGAYTAQVGVR